MQKGHPVKLLFIGSYPSDVKEFFDIISPNLTPKAFRFSVPNFSITQLNIPISKRFALVLNTRSPSGELIPINQCTLPDNTLVSNKITLFNGISTEKENDITEISKGEGELDSVASELINRKLHAKEIKEKSEIRERILKELQKNGSVMKGEIILWDLHSFGDRGKLIEKYFERSESLIQQNKEDIETIETDWQKRYDNMRFAMDKHVKSLQNKVDDLQQQIILQKIVYGERMTDLVSEAVVDSMTTQFITQEEMKTEIKSLKDSLEKKRKSSNDY